MPLGDGVGKLNMKNKELMDRLSLVTGVDLTCAGAALVVSRWG